MYNLGSGTEIFDISDMAIPFLLDGLMRAVATGAKFVIMFFSAIGTATSECGTWPTLKATTRLRFLMPTFTI